MSTCNISSIRYNIKVQKIVIIVSYKNTWQSVNPSRVLYNDVQYEPTCKIMVLSLVLVQSPHLNAANDTTHNCKLKTYIMQTRTAENTHMFLSDQKSKSKKKIIIKSGEKAKNEAREIRWDFFRLTTELDNK